MRRAVRAKPQPAPRKHELPHFIGAPLWAAGTFVRRHWKIKAWALSVILAGYLPYVMHSHASYKDDRRCDRINYAAQVAYQYGCTGRACSDDLLAYEQTVLMTYGALQEGCHAPPPIRPDQAVSMFINVAGDALQGLQDTEAIMPEPPSPKPTLVADAQG